MPLPHRHSLSLSLSKYSYILCSLLKVIHQNSEHHLTQMEHQTEPANSYEDADDELSLRDLPINAADSLRSSPRTSISAPVDLFNFSFDSCRSKPNDIIFSGQIVAYNGHCDSACFSNSSSFRRDNHRFASARIDSSSAKVNITSMSAKSRRRMFMFGPVKFKPEMELSAIRERQGRRTTPSSLFPVVVVDEMEGNGVVKGGVRITVTGV